MIKCTFIILNAGRFRRFEVGLNILLQVYDICKKNRVRLLKNYYIIEDYEDLISSYAKTLRLS